jgi:hypothetical protein
MTIASMPIWQPGGRAARLVGLLACSLLSAAAPAKAGATPDNLQGIWEREQVAEPSDHPRVVEIEDGILRVDGGACRIVGLRPLSDQRWYLDATCSPAESAVVQLDLLLLDAGRLLIARRVLGTAELYRRRPPSQGAG